MQPDLNFTDDEVKQAAAPKDPWQRQEQFSASLKLDQMEQTADRYAQAAAQTTDVAQLAQRADQTSARAGSDIIDPNNRTDATRMGLQDNGQKMFDVVDILAKSINLAYESDETVRSEIPPLETAVQAQRDAAWDDWRRLHEDMVAKVNAIPEAERRFNPPPVDVAYLDYSARVHARLGVYDLPENLATQVRDNRLQQAVQIAQRADTEIAEHIEVYRRRLDEHGDELTRLGYDVAGPLGLWTSAEAGAIDARMLSEELAKPEHLQDADRIEVLTQALERINAMGQEVPGQDGRQLDPDELAYLKAFNAGMDMDAWVGLGDESEAARRNVANGLNLLTNPAIGGIDPSAPPAPNDPDPLRGIRPFIYDQNSGGLWESLFESPLTKEELEGFNAFGNVVGSATIEPGDQMARDQAAAAVDWQDRSREQYDPDRPDIAGSPPNTGSSALLENVALNTEESAGLLTDQATRESLLGQRWETGEGIGALVDSGTSLPPGVDRNADAAEQYHRAGFEVLKYAAQNPDAIHGTIPNEYGTADHDPLQSAIGNTAERYLPQISQQADASAMQAEWARSGEHHNLLGEDYRWGFTLTQEDRRGLFDTIARSHPAAGNEFFHDLGAWERATAHNAFVALNNGDPTAGHYFDAIGRMAGTEEYTRSVLPVEDNTRLHQSAIAGNAAVGAAIKDTTAPVPAKLAIIGGTLLVGEGIRHALPDPAEAMNNARQHALLFGDEEQRVLLAESAAGARYGGVERLGPVPSDQAAREAWLTNAQSSGYENYYQTYRNAYGHEIPPPN
ncbi:hypothetical protein [Streptomyces sp. 6N223]|uniref:hypothetical protein n=1 Tax=Streptomyces sp. 6N223 TaxID=3457412 RepID=UPI003FD1E69C